MIVERSRVRPGGTQSRPAATGKRSLDAELAAVVLDACAQISSAVSAPASMTSWTLACVMTCEGSSRACSWCFRSLRVLERRQRDPGVGRVGPEMIEIASAAAAPASSVTFLKIVMLCLPVTTFCSPSTLAS